jgi:hypothetical protein
MKTTSLAIRLSQDELDALGCAAEDADRPVSGLARWVLDEWLRDHGYLKRRPAPPHVTEISALPRP